MYWIIFGGDHISLNQLFIKWQKIVHQNLVVKNFKEFDRDMAKVIIESKSNETPLVFGDETFWNLIQPKLCGVQFSVWS